MTSFGIVIPARMSSTRLPGKPLLDIAGKPLIRWVLEAAQSSAASYVIVAADDQRIVEVVEAAGGKAVLTSPDHPSGTDRLAEVARRAHLEPDSILVNWQGDEPLLEPHLVELVARALDGRPELGMATLATPLTTVEELFSPHVVKVVLDREGLARTFSRAPVPWARDHFAGARLGEEVGSAPARNAVLPADVPYLRHVGLYAYRVRTLLALTEEKPPAWELAESLEQLRALWMGLSIHVSVVANAPHHGVDTPEDAERVARVLRV